MSEVQATLQQTISHHLYHWKLSSLSIAEYCRRNNLKATRFYGWQKRDKSRKKQLPISKVDFVEIPFAQPPSARTSSSIRIVFTELNLPAEVSPVIVSELISLLGSRR